MKSRILSIPLALSVLLLLIGYISRVQHWPYGIEIEQTAFTLIALLYSVRYFRKNKKTYKDTMKFMLVISWCGLSLIAPLKLQSIEYVIYIVMVFGLLWFFLELTDTIKLGLSHSNMILVAGTLTLAIATVFRIQHWPFSSLIHLLGMLIIIIGFLSDKYWQRKMIST